MERESFSRLGNRCIKASQLTARMNGVCLPVFTLENSGFLRGGGEDVREKKPTRDSGGCFIALATPPAASDYSFSGTAAANYLESHEGESWSTEKIHLKMFRCSRSNDYFTDDGISRTGIAQLPLVSVAPAVRLSNFRRCLTPVEREEQNGEKKG